MAKKGRTEVFQVAHVSMAFWMTDDEFESDLRRIINDARPDVICTTESRTFVARFRQVCRATGYRPIEHKHKNSLIAVNVSREKLHVKDAGAVFVIPGKERLYSTRSVNWVVCMFHGVRIFVHTAHWVPPHAPGYEADHRKITQAMITQVRKHAKKGNVSFFTGDINEDDDPTGRPRGTGWNQMCRENGLMTIWDDKGVYPPTMGGGSRTIDVVGRYKEDHVKALRYRIWAKAKADHRPLTVWYEIDIDNKQKEQNGNGGNDGGGGGNNDNPDAPNDGDHTGDNEDNDPYSTGKLISWEDYLDDTLYDLPAATDDSDTTNG